MTTTWDELKSYGHLAKGMFVSSYDLHKIPGPRGHRMLGNLRNIMRPDYHVQVLEWANEFGGLYKFSLGCQWVVVISDPALAAQVLGRGASSVPRKCVGYQFFDLATNHLSRRSFFTTSDELQWAAVRKAAAPAFNMANVRRSFPHVLRHSQGIADELLLTSPSHGPSHGASHGSHDQGVDIQEHLELALLNVFVEALFDIEAKDFPGHEVAAAMNLVLEEANERLKVPLRGLGMYLAYPAAYRSVRSSQQLLGDTYGYLADVVRSRRGTAQGEDSTNLWACLARCKDPRTGQPLSRDQLIPEIGAFMMAGFDTSSHTIAWCLYALATHPHAQRDVHRELAGRGLLRGPGAVEARDPTMDDLSQLPLLNCIIDETMRMYPVAATASVREVVSPVSVGGYTIPPGVIVWPMLYALHNANHNWDSPHEFRPERWREKHGHALQHQNDTSLARQQSGAIPVAAEPAGDSATRPATEVKDGRAARSFLPFSDGIKNCLGQNLGLMEVRTVLAVLLSRFHFQLHPSMGGPKQVQRNMIMSLTLKIKGGLRLLATPLDTLDSLDDATLDHHTHHTDVTQGEEEEGHGHRDSSMCDEEELMTTSHSSYMSHGSHVPSSVAEGSPDVVAEIGAGKGVAAGGKGAVSYRQGLGSGAGGDGMNGVGGSGRASGWRRWVASAGGKAAQGAQGVVAAGRGLISRWQGVDGEELLEVE